MKRAVAAALLGVSAFGCAAGARGAGVVAGQGVVIAVGGALDPDNAAVYRAILDARPGNRPICVLPTASAEPERSMRLYVEDFERYGGAGAAVGVPLFAKTPERAADPQVVETLEACDGYFFTGGDQSRIVDAFRPPGGDTPAYDAIARAATRRAAVIAGSSAGAAMLSDPMIGGGSSADALQEGAVGEDGVPGVWLRNGMGFLRAGLTGQHHLARGRAGRLLVATLALPEAGPTARRAFGIDENTALVVPGSAVAGREGAVRVVGGSAVLVLDRIRPGRGTPPLDGARLQVALVADGDRYRLPDARWDPAPDRRDVAQEGPAPQPTDDPWRDDTLHRWLTGFARSAAAEATFVSAGWRFVWSKGPGFRATTGGPGTGTGSGSGAVVGAGPFELLVERETP